MKNNEKISIIIPVYNLENYIERCLQSVINQTYKNLEIIIVDDGSTDNSSNIINKYTAKDKRISYYKQVNKGPGSARNLGIEKCSGSWIAFVDGDDYLDKNYLKYMISETKKNNCDLVLCNFKTDVSNNYRNMQKAQMYSKKADIANFLLIDTWKNKMCTFTAFGKLYKSKLIKEKNIRFPDKFYNAEDLIFSIDYWYTVKSFIYINKPLYTHIIHKNSLSTEKVNIKHVYKGRKLFDIKLIEYIKKNGQATQISKINKIKWKSLKIIMRDLLRIIHI